MPHVTLTDPTAAELEAAIRQAGGRGHYRVIHGGTYEDQEGRSWTSECGDREMPCCGNPGPAAQAFLAAVVDVPHGAAFRYCRIERAGEDVVAEVTHTGRIRVRQKERARRS